jgi:hypothetical protein
VDDEERIEQFQLLSGLAAQSVAGLRPDFPRWIRRLHSKGLPVPSRLEDNPRSVNVLSMMVRQGAADRDPRMEHYLRNTTDIRAYKP